MSFHRLLMSAALAGGLACAAPFAAAREPVRGPVAVVAVEGVDVEQVAAIGAGVPLNFTVFGTPGAIVVVRIDGGRRVLQLHEAEPGVYEGSYLIDALDAIRPESRVTATLQKNGAVAYAALDEPLLLARGTVPWNAATPGDGQAAAAAPLPTDAASPALVVAPSPALVPSPSPSTSPGFVSSPFPSSSPALVPSASASAAPAAAPGPAPSTSPAPPTGTPVPLVVAAAAPVPIVVAPPQRVPPAARAATPPSERTPCADCAVVESVRPVEMAPRGGVIGTIGGAIAGAILGKELGEAHNRRVLSVLGAIGGAFAGRQIERHATQSTQYDVDLRLADGTVLKRRYEQAPPFAAGQTIRLGPSYRGSPGPGL